MSMVVVFPAPFGPSKATISPEAIDSVIPRTAWTSLKFLYRSTSSIALVLNPASDTSRSAIQATTRAGLPANAIWAVLDWVGSRSMDKRHGPAASQVGADHPPPPRVREPA